MSKKEDAIFNLERHESNLRSFMGDVYDTIKTVYESEILMSELTVIGYIAVKQALLIIKDEPLESLMSKLDERKAHLEECVENAKDFLSKIK